MRAAYDVGCPYAAAAPGKPKAHFSLRFFTFALSKPAADNGWKRVLVGVTPQPDHSGGWGGGSRSRAQTPFKLAATARSDFPRNSATADFSAELRFLPCHRIRPVCSAMRIAARDMLRRAIGSGARRSLPSKWQLPHFLAKTTAALTGGGGALCEQPTEP